MRKTFLLKFSHECSNMSPPFFISAEGFFLWTRPLMVLVFILLSCFLQINELLPGYSHTLLSPVPFYGFVRVCCSNVDIFLLFFLLSSQYTAERRCYCGLDSLRWDRSVVLYQTSQCRCAGRTTCSWMWWRWGWWRWEIINQISSYLEWIKWKIGIYRQINLSLPPYGWRPWRWTWRRWRLDVTDE